MIRLAICGVEGPNLQSLARRLRGAVIDPPGERDAAVVLDHSADAVATAEIFLRSGMSVLMSTAVCPSLQSLEKYVELCRRGTGRLAVLNSRRYLPSLRLIKDQIEAGKLGEVGLVRLHHWEPDEKVSQEAALANNLDLAVWMVGAQPSCLYAVADASGSYTQVHLGFAGGAAALIDVSLPRPAPEPMSYIVRQDYRSLSVIGSSGAAYADDTMREPEGRLSLAAMVQEFVDGLVSGRDFSLTVQDWRQVLQAAETARRSLATHQAVRLGGV
jgi:predicted dehydrogenase